MARTACLVCIISTVNGCSKKGGKCLRRCGPSSGHTTKLKQSIFFTYLCLIFQGVHVHDGPVQRQRLQHPRRAREPGVNIIKLFSFDTDDEAK
jgi:hypothetical protein